MAGTRTPYRRILLKLSGEAIGGGGINLDVERLRFIANEIAALCRAGIELALVVGAGNLLRGAEVAKNGMNRATADQLGMLATVMNGLALQDALEKVGIETRVCSAVTMIAVCEPFARRRALRHIEKGRIPILVGGTGNPFFTTDTTAALRAAEIGADAILKATKVDGVYSADPKQDPAATRLEHVTFSEVLAKRLNVMDAAAIAMCRESSTPIVVFDMNVPGNALRVARGEAVGTLISE